MIKNCSLKAVEICRCSGGLVVLGTFIMGLIEFLSRSSYGHITKYINLEEKIAIMPYKCPKLIAKGSLYDRKEGRNIIIFEWGRIVCAWYQIAKNIKSDSQVRNTLLCFFYVWSSIHDEIFFFFMPL